jgi:hypothetical protein
MWAHTNLKLKPMFDADLDRLIVTVATLTVMALGAAVVPMCEFISTRSTTFANCRKSHLHQSTKSSTSSRSPSKWQFYLACQLRRLAKKL